MQLIGKEKRWLLTAVLLLLLLIAVTALTLTLLFINIQQAAHYPGARQLSAHSDFQLTPTTYFRQDSSYRTGDPFPTITNWYQKQLGLGPESAAQSQCSHLYNSSTQFIIREQASVTVCDTTNGRLIFVQRVVSLDLR